MCIVVYTIKSNIHRAQYRAGNKIDKMAMKFSNGDKAEMILAMSSQGRKRIIPV